MIIERLESKIKALPYDKVIPFSYIDIEGISIDTRRQYLHRLHDRGLISIVDGGHFRRIKHKLSVTYTKLQTVMINNIFNSINPLLSPMPLPNYQL